MREGGSSGGGGGALGVSTSMGAAAACIGCWSASASVRGVTSVQGATGAGASSWLAGLLPRAVQKPWHWCSVRWHLTFVPMALGFWGRALGAQVERGFWAGCSCSWGRGPLFLP